MPRKKLQKKTSYEEKRDSYQYKPKANSSFSIPKKQRAKLRESTKPEIMQLHSYQEVPRLPDFTNASRIENKTSTVSDMASVSNTDDDEWESDASVEQMRSSDLTSTAEDDDDDDDDEWESDVSVEQMRSSEFCGSRSQTFDDLVVPPIKEVLDPAMLEHDGNPIAHSTLLPEQMRNVHDSLPSVSYIKDKESNTLREIPPFPGLSFIRFEKEEPLADSRTYPFSNDFETGVNIDRDNDKKDDYKEQVSDEEDARSLASTVLNFKIYTSSERRRRKRSLEKAQSIHKKLYINISTNAQKKRIRNCRSVQTESDYALNNPVSLEHENEGESSFRDMNDCENDFENAHNIPHKELPVSVNNPKNIQTIQNQESVVEEMDKNFSASRQRKVINEHFRNGNETQKGDFILIRSQHSPSVSRKQENENEKSLNDMGNDHVEYGFEEPQDILYDTPKKKGKLYIGAGIECDTLMKVGGRQLFQNLNESDIKDKLENVQNSQKEMEELDKLSSLTNRGKRKMNKSLVADNETQKDASIRNRSKNSASASSTHDNEEINSFENINERDIADKLENVQNSQKEMEELDKLSSLTNRGKRKMNKSLEADNETQKDASIRNRSKNSASASSTHDNEEINSFENINERDIADKLENVQNSRKELGELDKLSSLINRKKRKVNKSLVADNEAQKDASIPNRSKNSASASSTHDNEEMNSFENINERDIADKLENVQNSQKELGELDKLSSLINRKKRKMNKSLVADDETQKDSSIPNRSQNSASARSTHDNEDGDSSADINESDREDNYENNPNFFIENEEMQGEESEENNPSEIEANRRSADKRVRFAKETRERANRTRTKDFNRKRIKRSRKVKNLFKDMVNYTKRDSSEEAEINTFHPVSKKLERETRLRNRTNNRTTRSQKVAHTSSRSDDSVILQDAENNQAKAHQWPLCCLLTSKKRSIPVLKPIIYEGAKLDCLLPFFMPDDSKKKCRH